MKLISDREVKIANEEFLQGLFGDEWPNAHVTGFYDDPSDIDAERRALCWGGGRAEDRLRRFEEDDNQYFTISLFRPLEDGRHVRRKAQFDATFVIVADDVAEKVPVENAERLPPPSYKLMTSAGSEQWGWILAEPCEDIDRVNNLLDGLVAQGLAPDGTDPGMKGVTRYVRLPGGSNTKAKRFVEGRPFKCYLTEWEPDRLYSIETLAEAFLIDLDRPRNDGNSSSLSPEDDIARNHPIWAYLNVEGVGNEDWVRVECPNAAKHTGGDASGAAVRITTDGRVTFQCHHGHCNGDETGKKLTGPKVIKLLDEQNQLDGRLEQEVKDYQRKIYMDGVTAIANSGHSFPAPRERRLPPSEGGGSESAGEDSEKKTFLFDPLRYVYMAHENRFFDLATHNTIAPAGLDSLYRKIMPPGKGRVMASEYLLSTMDASLSTADGLGWVPTGVEPPSRENVMFEDEGKRLINQWRGFSLSPMEGDVSLWLDHAEYVLPDEDQREVVLDYLAAIVQRVDSKPGFFIGHRGAHRVGKDLLYRPLMQAMGTHCAREVSIDNLTGGWGDYIKGLKLVVVTEVDKAQDRKIANTMKTVVAPTAGGRRTLNLKGGKVSVEVDAMGGIMMSNKRDFMVIERGDRRYFVVDSWVPPKEPSYYDRLTKWYDTPGSYEAVLDYLLNRDISGFDHKILPYMTDGALEMVEASRYDYEVELAAAIEDKEPPFHTGVVTVKEARRWAKSEGLKCGATGLENALAELGWHKFRGHKWVENRTQATPTFYCNELEKDAEPREIYDYFSGKVG